MYFLFEDYYSFYLKKNKIVCFPIIIFLHNGGFYLIDLLYINKEFYIIIYFSISGIFSCINKYFFLL